MQLELFKQVQSIDFSGTDFMLDAGELSPDLYADLLACACPGDAETAVNHVLNSYQITGTPADCVAYLLGYGAWELEELTDHRANLQRLVWLTGGDLAERGEVYFSAY